MKQFSSSLAAQRQRLFSYLKEHGSITTYQARDLLGIAHPSGRIRELRGQGYLILTSSEPLADANGVIHPRSARYVLLSEVAANDE